MSLIKVIDSDNPKYKQIISSIEEAINNGELKKGDKLPSINSIRNRFSLSRDTVLLAYSELKTRGIVKSIAGKGYYVNTVNTNIFQKIFLLFDELNVFKEDLYNSFLKHIDDNIQVDIFFHNFNYDVFSKLIYDNIGDYNKYIIMPSNLEDTHTVIEKLPQEKVYILDQIQEKLENYQAIYQNFEKDIYNNLTKAESYLTKYDSFVFLNSKKKQPKGIINGFNKFCKEHHFKCEVLESIEDRIPIEKEVYVIPDDKNLIIIIKKIREAKLKLGIDVGIIAYNETLLKEVVEGGITVISTNFKLMGEQLANMIKTQDMQRIENPSDLIIRNSL